MRLFSKRWRKIKRNQFRRRAFRVRRGLKFLGQRLNERNIDRYNALIRWVNRRVRYPHEKGHALIDGAIECPKCGNLCLTESDPNEWIRNEKSRWRRGRERTWRVTNYWGGTAQCCGLLLAFQPDGHAECYELPSRSPLTSHP